MNERAEDRQMAVLVADVPEPGEDRVDVERGRPALVVQKREEGLPVLLLRLTRER